MDAIYIGKKNGEIFTVSEDFYDIFNNVQYLRHENSVFIEKWVKPFLESSFTFSKAFYLGETPEFDEWI